MNFTAIRTGARSVPPTLLILFSALSVQMGAALAKQLFVVIDPIGATLVRTGLGALLLLLVWRPRLRNHSIRDYALISFCGLAIAGTNLAFYSAIEHIPLGVASAIEFIGPLGAALVGSRRLLDIIWVVLASTGLVLLTPISGASIDPLGCFFALLSAGCWAAYIFLAVPMGRVFSGQEGLTLSMLIAAIFLLPFSTRQIGNALLDSTIILYALGVAILACVVPYSLEFSALRRLPPRIFGVLISVEPAVAALVGFIFLGERLGLKAVFAIGLLVIALVGTTLFSRNDLSHE